MTRLRTGSPYPLGASVTKDGVNFAVHAGYASRVELCLYDAHGHEEIARLDLPASTHGVWHGLLPHATAGLVYGYRVHGPWAPRDGHRHNPKKLLLDPYARALVGQYRDHPDFEGMDLGNPGQPDPVDNGPLAVKAQVVHEAYDWGDDTAPATPWSQTVLYEAHVRGLTMRHPAIPPELRGSYAALAHPALIAHFKRLGITALELLPVHAHADEPRLQRMNLSNYWGYNTLSFFAPEPRYWSGQEGSTPLSEFRDAVKALHAAGIEVILDVVFNHSAELDAEGPTLSLRGFDNASYYWLAGDGGFENWTGCGNTLNLTQPRVIQLVMDSLRYWAVACRVDGFRFDLAPVLGRTPRYSAIAPLLAAIAQDPQLARLKLIAEPWDIGPGGYQIGQFPAGWAEWNDQYRDTMRRFWLHDGVSRGQFARRFAASSDLFHQRDRRPWASVNFVTAHDGFTLADLVSYNRKHNLANGEHNRDGHNQNLSWNCGVEGPTDDADIQLVRLRARKALLATLLLSQGTPMLLAGDELGHSQSGNNNAYCQDNDLTWLDWGNGKAPLADYIGELVALRRACPALRSGQWWPEDTASDHDAVEWRNPSGEPLKSHDWEDSAGRALMIQLSGFFLILINASANQVPFRLPAGCWRVKLASTEDRDSVLYQGECRVAARSLTILTEDACEPGLFANPFLKEETP
ncbi:glycogen debranching protein GlgX [Chitinolyticbacter meiyuanensis]|uniref:glycogen debranching protein GlgX n=1 Tax=Chitinolyticbacter meiyuanensis TaxID=682798 RepID=UPI0011E5C5C6|nr:glycogen debranching protein GlgX [Chitinolyticbacter meiyuanensis]